MLLKSEKVEIVNAINQEAKQALDAVIADYRGTDVGAMTELRRQARANNVYLKISRNTLIKRALEDTDYACMQPELTGPNIVGFSREEPGAAARLFRDFIKENPDFAVKCLAVNGELLPAGQLSTLANLPTRTEALAQVARVLQAPVEKIAVTLNQIPTGLARVLLAVNAAKS